MKIFKPKIDVGRVYIGVDKGSLVMKYETDSEEALIKASGRVALNKTPTLPLGEAEWEVSEERGIVCRLKLESNQYLSVREITLLLLSMVE